MIKNIIFITVLFSLVLTANAQQTLRNVYTKDDPEVPNRQLWWQDNRDRTRAVLVDGYCHIIMDDYTMTWHFDRGVPRAGTVALYRHDGTFYGSLPYDSQGRYDGATTTYYINGTTQGQTQWRKGLPDGTHKEWNPNGQLTLRTAYCGGNRCGISTAWRPDGKLISEWMYDNTGEQHGLCITYLYDPADTGPLTGRLVEYYRHGTPVDSSLYYTIAPSGRERLQSRTLYDASDSKIVQMDTYLDDIHNCLEYTDGTLTTMTQFTNGSLTSRLHYRNDKQHGRSVIYYPGTTTIYRIEKHTDGSLTARATRTTPDSPLQYYRFDPRTDNMESCTVEEFNAATPADNINTGQ